MKNKEYWVIDSVGDLVLTVEGGAEDRKIVNKRCLVGNYFETREEAEKAVKKLVALRRLKELGFKFISEPEYYQNRISHFDIQITAEMPTRYYLDSEVSKDLDLLFGEENK